MELTLDSSVQNKVQKWLDGNYDIATKNAIQRLLDNNQVTELVDSFYKDLEFGTGGLRGIMGVGTNRINKYTVGAATQGLCHYLKKKYPNESIKVAIAHDSRNQSDYFARVTASVFSANGIYVYFFKELRPTPLLSFAIRHLGCKSGVMLTASHNPKEYNGYKAYGADGGQFISPDDKMIIDEVANILSLDDINFSILENNIEEIGEELDELYLSEIKKLSLAQEAITRQENLKIVYSSIHGTGITLVPKALHKFGFRNINIVAEQAEPDGNFPTVIYPNPEEEEALTLALQKAKVIDADLVLATDPDADRVGIAVKDIQGSWILLNGNQTGSLLVNYMLTAWQNNKKLTGNQYITTTIVTTPLIKEIANAKKVMIAETLTGFKWIGALMTSLVEKHQFIVGGEESYGYLVGDLVRDKDAVVSCALIAEMTAYYKDQGISLFEAMIDMYVEYGFYKEKLISLTRKGKTGAEEIIAIMERFRRQPPTMLGGSKVVALKDYVSGEEKNLLDGTVSKLSLPKSDVLQFVTVDGSIVSIRPSGTEPKIKFYCSSNLPLPNKMLFNDVSEALDLKIATIITDLGV